jgi:hypothetical protein
MASQKAFAHRPGAFAPTGRTQQQAFTQQQTFTVQQQPQPVAPPPQPQPQPQAIPGFDAQLAAEDPYYAAYIQQQQQAQFVPNRGAQSAQEAFQMSQDYVANLKAQYDEANDCAKFNMTTEEALKNRKQLDQMVDELEKDIDLNDTKPVLDTIDKYRWMIAQVVMNLRKPEIWIPKQYANDKYRGSYKNAGEKIAGVLEQYSSKLTLMQDKKTPIHEQ